MPVGGPVLALPGRFTFERGQKDALILDHMPRMTLSDGTLKFRFSVQDIDGRMALMSKDASGQDDPGYMAIYVEEDGCLYLRMQTEDHSHYLGAQGAVELGKTYDLAVSFVAQGLQIYLNGVRAAYDTEITQGLDLNPEYLIFGAQGWANTPGTTDRLHDGLTGHIADIALYDSQLDAQVLYGNMTWKNILTLDRSNAQVNLRNGDSGQLELYWQDGMVEVPMSARFLALDDITVRVRDLHVGSGRDNYLESGDGSDFTEGRNGDDTLSGRGNDDWLYGGNGQDRIWGDAGDDLLAGNRGDDSLYGGDGQDRLRGGEGHDTLLGDAGDDVLIGGWGDDDIYGHNWHSGDETGLDTVIYAGNFADYHIRWGGYHNSGRGEFMDILHITDHASGGADGYYEGADDLIDIDRLVFADQTVMVSDLVLI